MIRVKGFCSRLVYIGNNPLRKHKKQQNQRRGKSKCMKTRNQTSGGTHQATIIAQAARWRVVSASRFAQHNTNTTITRNHSK